MNIRKCRADDLEAVYALICELEEEELDYADFSRVFLSKLGDENCQCLVGAENGMIIAYIGMFIGDMLHHAGKVLTIDELIVHSPFRSLGYGKILLNEAVCAAREAGCGSVELTSSFDRLRAHKFYEANGFSKTSFKFVREVSE